MEQPTLFNEVTCAVCGQKMTGIRKECFFDGDTGEFVHMKWACKSAHYRRKRDNDHPDLPVTVSEWPVTEALIPFYTSRPER